MAALNLIIYLVLSLLLGYGLGKVYDGIKRRRQYRLRQDDYITYLERRNAQLERSLGFYRLQRELGE